MPDQGTELTEEESLGLAAAKKRKGKARFSSKQDLRRTQPLPVKGKVKKASLELTPEEERQQQVLLERLQQTEKLPAQSEYARHQKACILKALALLEASRCVQTLKAPSVFFFDYSETIRDQAGLVLTDSFAGPQQVSSASPSLL